MNSLRGRQLVSSFGILMASILMLGVLLYIFTQQRELENQQFDLEELGFELLGFFNFDNGKFQIDPDTRDEFNQFLNDQELGGTQQKKVAYIQSTGTRLIQWHSIEPDEDLSAASQSLGDILVTFDINSSTNETNIKLLKPEQTFTDTDGGSLSRSEEYIVYSYGFQHKPYGHFQLVLAQSADHLVNTQKDMLKHLSWLFIASAFLVLLAQLATSFWVIAPIKDFDEEIKRIESGDQETIANQYPEELVPIKSTINALLQYEKGQKRRYRDALDDLAHSLKTPLSAMQGFIKQEENKLDDNPSLQGIATQLERMKDIVSYQLRRAVVTHHHALITPQAIRPVLIRLRDSLLKVHHDKTFDLNINVDGHLKCRMDDDDMMELFGNLINNACRFCNEIVEVNGRQDGNMLIIDIDDDGMGFPDNNPSKLLQRGIRADSQTEGQGIGLAVCTEIVEASGGKIELLVSPQVGARVRLSLPT
jgi:signal transduction histidine kinase